MAKEKEVSVVGNRWADVNKGDQRKYIISRRLVGNELKAKTKEAPLAHKFFSAMPLCECMKICFSLLVMDEIPGLEGEELDI